MGLRKCNMINCGFQKSVLLNGARLRKLSQSFRGGMGVWFRG